MKYRGSGLEKEVKKKFFVKKEVTLAADLLESKAFCELKGALTIRALIRFYHKRKWSVIKQHGKKKRIYVDEPIAFCYAEAQEMGIGPSRFHEIIRELYRSGFIDMEHQGGGLLKDYSTYTLSERWRKYGKPEFEHKEKPRSVRPGRDIKTLKRQKELKEKNPVIRKQSRSSVTVTHGVA
jgi:hypothetical protein